LKRQTASQNAAPLPNFQRISEAMIKLGAYVMWAPSGQKGCVVEGWQDKATRKFVGCPLLAELKIAKCGFHAFRRFRATWLRKQRTQESVIKAWLGHSTGNTITDFYDRTATDVEHCKNVVGQVGIGFDLTSIVLSVLKDSDTETREVAVAA